jgi:ABC-type glutathione transport system ATPase component
MNPSGSSLLRLEGVSKSYASSSPWPWITRGKVVVLDSVTLEIDSGEIVGLVGRSGVGKSTLARILAGMERPDSGTRTYLGRQWNSDRIPPSLRREVQYVFQNPASSLNPRMTAWHQLLEAPLCLRMGRRPAVMHRMQEIASLLGLEGSSLERYPHQFSGGQQQRLALARALSVEPRVLICDEITSALDSRNAENLASLLQRINREMGVAVTFVSHDLPLVEGLCRRILQLSEGRLEPFSSSSGQRT